MPGNDFTQTTYYKYMNKHILWIARDSFRDFLVGSSWLFPNTNIILSESYYHNSFIHSPYNILLPPISVKKWIFIWGEELEYQITSIEHPVPYMEVSYVSFGILRLGRAMRHATVSA